MLVMPSQFKKILRLKRLLNRRYTGRHETDNNLGERKKKKGGSRMGIQELVIEVQISKLP